MLNDNVRKLLAVLDADILDFQFVSPRTQRSIAEWILEDRKNTRAKKRLPESIFTESEADDE